MWCWIERGSNDVESAAFKEAGANQVVPVHNSFLSSALFSSRLNPSARTFYVRNVMEELDEYNQGCASMMCGEARFVLGNAPTL